MKTNYSTCLAKILQYEGGKVDHPRDPGGRTNQGVTQRVFTAYLSRKGKANRDVYKMVDTERDEIYRKQYWDAVKGDELPGGIDLAVFDIAVNSGPARGVKFLQKALGVKQDGLLGMVTVETAKKADPAKVVNAICDARLLWLRGLGTFGTFGKGWTRRVKDVRAASMKLV